MLGLLWRKGGQEIEGRLWFGRKRWIAVPFSSVAGNGCGRVTKMSLGGAPRTRQPGTYSVQVSQVAWISSAEAQAITHALFNFPDRTGADPGALRPLSLPPLLELFIN